MTRRPPRSTPFPYTTLFPSWATVTSSTNYNGSLAYTLTSGDGSKTVYAWYKDAANNVSATTSASIILDQTVPTNGTLTETHTTALQSQSNLGCPLLLRRLTT